MTGSRYAPAARRGLAGLVAAAALLVAWYFAARFVVANVHVLPTPIDVARPIWRDPSFFRPHLEQTAREAATGYAIGNLIAIALAITFVQLPIVEGVLMRVGLTIS